jgi:pyruvate dehydrogenase E2 component (dihydrolipoamide acetyltransferase)
VVNEVLQYALATLFILERSNLLMAVEVVFPITDINTKTGKIVKWLKSEGDSVEQGEIIAEVETEKVVIEVESPASGILRKILVNQGVEIPVLTVIAVITAVDEELPEKYRGELPLMQVAPEASVSQKKGKESLELPARQRGQEVKASPLARKLANECGIELSVVVGTGPGGRIIKEDVLRAAQEVKVQAPQPAQEEPGLGERLEPLSSVRQVIARRMTESFQAPHFYLTVEVDTQKLGETREQLMPVVENKVGIKLTYTDLIVKAAAKALEDNPSVNCAYADGNVRFFERLDVGLVAAIEGGLIVPVIRNANEKSIAEIAKTRAELTEKARDRKLTKEEMSNSTFTVSNLGMFGIDWFSAILQPPEAAILAVGRIVDKVVVRDGQIVIRPIMTLTLSIDHRVLDGVSGSNFLQSLKDYIENPASILI